MVNEAIKCNTCQWFELSGPLAPTGKCRVEPPKVSTTSPEAIWPIVKTHDWCSKYSAWTDPSKPITPREPVTR